MAKFSFGRKGKGRQSLAALSFDCKSSLLADPSYSYWWNYSLISTRFLVQSSGSAHEPINNEAPFTRQGVYS